MFFLSVFVLKREDDRILWKNFNFIVIIFVVVAVRFFPFLLNSFLLNLYWCFCVTIEHILQGTSNKNQNENKTNEKKVFEMYQE